jgi:hypothetical protein
MDQDELFVQGLRARADAAVPHVDVDVDRVVPRARRRRRVVRGAAGATTLALVLGATWGASAVLGAGPVRDVVPAGAGTTKPTPAEATVPPDGKPGSTVPAEAVIADDGTVTGVPGDPWEGDEPYWYEKVEWVDAGGTTRYSESWSSRERPGLRMTDGDVSRADVLGPTVVLGSYVLDGRRYGTLADPRVLPTDPDALLAVLRASVEQGRRPGTDDDKVVSMVHDALLQSGLLPQDLRQAFWDAARRVPGVEVAPGESRGRPAEVLTYRYVGTTGSERFVRDPATGVLEIGGLDSTGVVVVEQGPSGPPPVDPVSLVGAGCAEWRRC